MALERIIGSYWVLGVPKCTLGYPKYLGSKGWGRVSKGDGDALTIFLAEETADKS